MMVITTNNSINVNPARLVIACSSRKGSGNLTRNCLRFEMKKARKPRETWTNFDPILVPSGSSQPSTSGRFFSVIGGQVAAISALSAT